MKATVHVKGIVQGVGFRPFIYNLAVENDLTGYVVNVGDAGVKIVAEGTQKNISEFLNKIKQNKPVLARIESMDVQWVSTKSVHKSFVIKKSIAEKTGEKSIIPPDVSICDKCIQELDDKSNRRYHYFFTTCTNCGPRYTIITHLPYDRPSTTMKPFPLCNECEQEYETPTLTAVSQRAAGRLGQLACGRSHGHRHRALQAAVRLCVDRRRGVPGQRHNRKNAGCPGLYADGTG